MGGGVEHPLLGNWSAKLEYLYVDLGKNQLFNVALGTPETVSVTGNIVRVSLAYSFGDNPAITRH